MLSYQQKQWGRMTFPPALYEVKEVFGFDCYSPKEIAERVENTGVIKANLPLLSQAALGLLAGGFIGLGGIFFTLVVSDANLSFAIARAWAEWCSRSDSSWWSWQVRNSSPETICW